MPEPASPQDAAVWYYLSDERHKQFDDLLDHLERTVGKAMLEQRIPAKTIPGSDIMPDWTEFETLPREGRPWVSFTAHDNGDGAKLEDSQEFSAVVCMELWRFTTADVGRPLLKKTPRSNVVSLGPMSYDHYRATLDGTEPLRPVDAPDPNPGKSMYVKYRTGGEPSIFQPLLRDQPSLYEIWDETGKRLSKSDIQTRDASFIEEVRTIDMNSSDCADEHQLG